MLLTTSARKVVLRLGRIGTTNRCSGESAGTAGQEPRAASTADQKRRSSLSSPSSDTHAVAAGRRLAHSASSRVLPYPAGAQSSTTCPGRAASIAATRRDRCRYSEGSRGAVAFTSGTPRTSAARARPAVPWSIARNARTTARGGTGLTAGRRPTETRGRCPWPTASVHPLGRRTVGGPRATLNGPTGEPRERRPQPVLDRPAPSRRWAGRQRLSFRTAWIPATSAGVSGPGSRRGEGAVS